MHGTQACFRERNVSSSQPRWSGRRDGPRRQREATVRVGRASERETTLCRPEHRGWPPLRDGYLMSNYISQHRAKHRTPPPKKCWLELSLRDLICTSFHVKWECSEPGVHLHLTLQSLQHVCFRSCKGVLSWSIWSLRWFRDNGFHVRHFPGDPRSRHKRAQLADSPTLARRRASPASHTGVKALASSADSCCHSFSRSAQMGPPILPFGSVDFHSNGHLRKWHLGPAWGHLTMWQIVSS